MADELGELIDPAEHARLLRIEEAAVALVNALFHSAGVPDHVQPALDALRDTLTDDLIEVAW